MSERSITIDLPSSLYDWLQARATQAERDVGAEVIELLTDVQTNENCLPTAVEAHLADMVSLPDEALWRLVHSRVPTALGDELAELNDKAQRTELSSTERRRQAELRRVVEHGMVERARAAALLKQRGHDLSSIMAS